MLSFYSDIQIILGQCGIPVDPDPAFYLFISQKKAFIYLFLRKKLVIKHELYVTTYVKYLRIIICIDIMLVVFVTQGWAPRSFPFRTFLSFPFFF